MADNKNTYLKLQKEINDKLKLKKDYQKRIQEAAKHIYEDPERFNKLKEFVDSRAGKSEKNRYCIGSGCYTLQEAGEILNYTSGAKLEQDVVSKKLKGYNIEPKIDNAEVGDIFQNNHWAFELGVKGAPYHNMLITDVKKGKNGNVNELTYFGSKGGIQSFNYHTLDSAYIEDNFRNNKIPNQLIKKEFVPNSLLKERNKVAPKYTPPKRNDIDYTENNYKNTYTKGLTGFENANANIFNDHINKKKKDLMSTYNISDKEFNTLQQLANGILMQESEFSTSARYMAKKVPGVQSLGKLLRGDIKDIGNDDTYSKGPGQIKPLGFPNKEAKKHNIAIDDYDATMLVLLDRYKHQVPSTKKNTPEGYIEAVNKYKGIDSPRNEYAKSVIDKSKTFIINGKPLDLDYEKTQQEREAKIVNTKKYNLDNFKVQPAVQESTKTTLNTPLNISPVVKKQFAEGGWLDKFEDGGEIEDMPFGMPLKEQNPFLVPEYNQPMVGKTILPDVNRPMLEGTNASEFKTSYNTGTPNEIQIPTIVGGQYIGNKGALERFKATGETFKTMADPGSYSNFYNQVGNLGLMKNKYAKGGWLDNLPKQKFDMGGFTNGEDNGGILPSWDKVKATLNPMNWGVDDYTKSGTRNQAFNAARKAGKKEFMWNNQRYNTRKDTDPIQYIGSNPNQKEYDNFLRKEYPEFFKTLNRGKNVGSITWKGSSDKESNRASINPRQTNSNINAGENPENAHRFIANMIAESSHLKDPKLFRNIFNPYDYKTTYEHIRHGEKKYEIPGTSEYDAHRLREPGMAMIAYGNLSPNNIKQIQKNLGVKDDGYFGPETYKAMQSKYANNPNIKEALTYHKLKYQDDDKNPIHFGDDINLVKAYLQEIESEVPFKNSGRIANKLKANKDYTDKALSNIIPGSGDYNVNKLQTTLVNKGYKLPKSTTKDGKLDGVYGPETKKALLDYQSRNVKTKLRNGGWLDDK